MTLATTEPRCAGTPCDECQSCERRISMPREWPVWLTMIVPPGAGNRRRNDMTDDQLAALAARLRDHASDYITHPDDACKHSDLLAASEHLRQCAESEHAIVPQGWKLVPLEPTTEMVEAAFDAIPASLLDGNIRTHYRAMLAAAPKPPSAQEEVVEALRDALQRVLDTREAEAKTYMSAMNAAENFSDASREGRAHLKAAQAASDAEKHARSVLAAQGGGQ